MKTFLAMFAFVSTTAAATVAPAPSNGWQYARWGMTPAQVQAASHGAVHALTAPNAVNYPLVGHYQPGMYSFEVKFNFDDDRLKMVNLLLEQPSADKCKKLEFDLNGKYGRGEEVGDLGMMKSWDQQAKNTRVVLSLTDATCDISYVRLASSNASGL